MYNGGGGEWSITRWINASSAIVYFNRKKRRRSASFLLEQKLIYFKNCKTVKPYIFKIHLLPLFKYRGCQRLFMRGFRFRSSSKKWPASPLMPSAKCRRRVGLRPTKPLVARGKNLWYPGYYLSNNLMKYIHIDCNYIKLQVKRGTPVPKALLWIHAIWL